MILLLSSASVMKIQYSAIQKDIVAEKRHTRLKQALLQKYTKNIIIIIIIDHYLIIIIIIH